MMVAVVSAGVVAAAAGVWLAVATFRAWRRPAPAPVGRAAVVAAARASMRDLRKTADAELRHPPHEQKGAAAADENTAAAARLARWMRDP